MGVESALDTRTNSLRSIEAAHALIHDGRLFCVSDTTLAVAAASSVDIVLAPPAGCYPHIVFFVNSDQPSTTTLYTGTTYTPGANVAGVNRNRVSTNVAALGVDLTATGVTPGTSLMQVRVPGSVLAGGSFSSQSEWILAAGTNYLLRVTNSAASAAANISIELMWYE